MPIELPQITEVHLINLSRPSATDIAIGEQFKVTAKATAGLTNLQDVIANGDISPPDESCVIGSFFNMTEVSSGNYEYVGTLTTNIDKAGREAQKITAGAMIFELGIFKIADEILNVIVSPVKMIESTIDRLKFFKGEIEQSNVKRKTVYTTFIDVTIILLESAIKQLEKDHKRPAVAKITAAQKILQVMIDTMKKDKTLPSNLRQTWTEKCNTFTNDLQKIINIIMPQRAKEDIATQDNQAQTLAQEQLIKHNLTDTDIDFLLKNELDIVSIYTYPNPYRKGVSGQGLVVSGKASEQEGITFRYKASGNVSRVTIEVYNLAGKLIDKLEDTHTPLSPLNRGEVDGEVNWSFVDKLSNGVYIYRITISDGVNTKSKTGKLVVVR